MSYKGKQNTEQYQEDAILTIEELARYLKISVASVYKLARAGEIPAFKVLNKWRFHRREIDELLTGRNHDHFRKTGTMTQETDHGKPLDSSANRKAAHSYWLSVRDSKKKTNTKRDIPG